MMAVALVFLLCLQGARAQFFCPRLVPAGGIPTVVYGVEDTRLNLEAAWKTALPTNDKAGTFHHIICASGSATCSAECEPEYTPWQEAGTTMRAVFSVLHGKLFLDYGYTSCGAPLDSGTNVQSSDFRKAFSVVGSLEQTKCILRYLTFQGLPNANSETMMARNGVQPSVRVTIEPPCEPTENCGWLQATESTTTVILAPRNDLPTLSTCPRMALTNVGARVREQTANSSVLHWDLASGAAQCARQPLYPGGPTIGAPPVGIGARLAGSATPAVGSLVRPYRVLPAAPGAGCAADERSYVYHIEDYTDATLDVMDAAVADEDLWQGHLTMQLVLRFQPDTANPPNNDPFEPNRNGNTMATQLGSVQKYCLRPAWDRAKRPAQWDADMGLYCARANADGLGMGVVVLSTPESQAVLQVRSEVVRAAVGNPPACDRSQVKGCTLEEVRGETSRAGFDRISYQCRCRSKVYEPTSTGGTPTSYSAALYFELHEFDDVTDVWEKGYIDLTYSKWLPVGTEKHAEVMTGTLVADPGQVTMRGGYANGSRFDWSSATPMGVTGTVRETADGFWIFNLTCTTNSSLNPTMSVQVEVAHGNLSLPDAAVSVATAADARGTNHSFTGTIDAVNKALSDLRYRLPGAAKPHFNTLSATSQLYGTATREKLNVVLDDRANGGNASLSGTVARVEYNLLVVGANDAPDVVAPAELRGSENTWAAIPGVAVRDVDAADAVGDAADLNARDASAPRHDIQAHAASTYGRFRVAAAAAGRVAFLKPLDAGACAAACEGVTIPVQPLTPAQQAALPAVCDACLQADARRVAAGEGAEALWLYGALADVDATFRTLEYKGNPGYNENTPRGGDPFDARGCARSLSDRQQSFERVEIGANDLGNVGCTTSEAFTDLHVTTVRLSPVEDPPFLIVARGGVSVCEVCAAEGSCGALCPGGEPVLSTEEDVAIAFNATHGPQVRGASFHLVHCQRHWFHCHHHLFYYRHQPIQCSAITI
jgi:hypothetical protein